MNVTIRALVPVVLGAAALTALLDLWIRSEPLDLARTAQVALSIALVAAIGVLLALVVRAERERTRR